MWEAREPLDVPAPVYDGWLKQTTDADYHRLRDKRGLPLQTLKRHGLAFNADAREWLIPFRNRRGEVVNLVRYLPSTGQKLNLPGLAVSLYGLDTLSKDCSKPLFLVEGSFDAMALDHHLRRENARPLRHIGGAWCQYLQG